MKKFEKLTTNELWRLRNEIVLNSIFISNYSNSFGYKKTCLCDFFSGSVDYLFELAEEDGFSTECFLDVAKKYDNKRNLKNWFDCYDDLSWVEFE